MAGELVWKVVDNRGQGKYDSQGLANHGNRSTWIATRLLVFRGLRGSVELPRGLELLLILVRLLLDLQSSIPQVDDLDAAGASRSCNVRWSDEQGW